MFHRSWQIINYACFTFSFQVRIQWSKKTQRCNELAATWYVCVLVVYALCPVNYTLVICFHFYVWLWLTNFLRLSYIANIHVCMYPGGKVAEFMRIHALLSVRTAEMSNDTASHL